MVTTTLTSDQVHTNTKVLVSAKHLQQTLPLYDQPFQKVDKGLGRSGDHQSPRSIL